MIPKIFYQEDLTEYFNNWCNDMFPGRQVGSIKKIYYSYTGTTPAGTGSTSIAAKISLSPNGSGIKGKTFYIGTLQTDSILLPIGGADYYLFQLTGTVYGDISFALYKKNDSAITSSYSLYKNDVAFDTITLGSLSSSGLSWLLDGYLVELL